MNRHFPRPDSHLSHGIGQNDLGGPETVEKLCRLGTDVDPPVGSRSLSVEGHPGIGPSHQNVQLNVEGVAGFIDVGDVYQVDAHLDRNRGLARWRRDADFGFLGMRRGHCRPGQDQEQKREYLIFVQNIPLKGSRLLIRSRPIDYIPVDLHGNKYTFTASIRALSVRNCNKHSSTPLP